MSLKPSFSILCRSGNNIIFNPETLGFSGDLDSLILITNFEFESFDRISLDTISLSSAKYASSSLVTSEPPTTTYLFKIWAPPINLFDKAFHISLGI